MNLTSVGDKTLFLQKILEAKLLRVFHYTRYSLLVSGQARLSHYCFFTDHATRTLDQAREIIRALVLLESTSDLRAPYGEQQIGQRSTAELLKQAIADETSLLSLCRDFQQQVKHQDTYFHGLARSLVIDTNQRIVSLVNLLHEVEAKVALVETTPEMILQNSDYIPLDYSSLRSA